MSWDRFIACCIALCAVLYLVYLVYMSTGELKFQMDFGNFAVGIGTMFMAYVTSKISSAQRKIDSAVALANFRLQWSENVRQNAAGFLAGARNLNYINEKTRILLSENKESAAQEYANEIGSCLFEIQKYANNLRLLLQIDKHEEIILFAEKIAVSSLEGKTNQANELVVQFSKHLEDVLEDSWKLAKAPLSQ